MASVNQEYVNRAYTTLIKSNAQRRRFATANYGVNTPIDAKRLPDVPSGKVILSQEVFQQLLKINDESEKANAEFAYFLTGITEGQTVKFDNIVWTRNQGNSATANFNPLLKNLNAYVKSVQQNGEKNAIVCNGHTHPKHMSSYAEDFSLADMAGFMQMKEENGVFRNGNIELCSGIMSDFNFNFCFYDNKMEDFYKFNDVVLELETGEQIPLSCYDRKVSRTEISNKLLENTEKGSQNSFRGSLRQGAPSLLSQRQFSERTQRRQEMFRRLGIMHENNNERTN